MQIDRMELARARLVMREAIQGWLFDPNVTLIGLGLKEREGQLEDTLSIRFHVRQKLSGFDLQAAAEAGRTRPIPRYISDFPTDLPEGVYQPQQWAWWNWRRQAVDPRAARFDPLRGGISISNERQNAFGTLGALVTDRQSGEFMCLSNWHVLVGDWGARVGQRIYQPGRLDGGTAADTVARLSRDAMAMNLDAAVAALTPGNRTLANDQLEIGPVQGIGRAELGMIVVKSGRKTRRTWGRVTDVESVAKFDYRGLTRIIRSVMTIDSYEPPDEISAGGDSGALWLDDATKQAVGLHFAGSLRPARALAMDMQSVLDALDVDLVS